jgi:hypothetical protein
MHFTRYGPIEEISLIKDRKTVRGCERPTARGLPLFDLTHYIGIPSVLGFFYHPSHPSIVYVQNMKSKLA